MSPLRPGSGGTLLSVHAQPGAKKDQVGGLHGDRLRVRTTSAPEGGRANARIEELVAEAFCLPRSRVRVVSGAASRQKLLLREGLDLGAAETRLAAIRASIRAY